MTCQRCLAYPQPPTFGQPRQCAFYERGGFKSDNWRCATLDALRSHLLWSFGGDSSIGIVRIPETDDAPEGFLVMTWHKMRGAVSNAVIVGDYPGTRDFRIEVAELILSEAQKRADDGDSGTEE